MSLMVLIYRANSRPDRLAAIAEAREHVEVIRLLVRLMKDLHQISLRSFVQVNAGIEDVSRQLAGWHKAYATQ